MTITKHLGLVLRLSRTKRKLTLAELEHRSGVSLGYISQIERGNHSPSLSVLYKLVCGLEMTMSKVFTEVEALIEEQK